MVIPPTVAPEAVEVPPIIVKTGPAQVPILSWCSAWLFLQCYWSCSKNVCFGLDVPHPISSVFGPTSRLPDVAWADVILNDFLLADLLVAALLVADLLVADLPDGWFDRTLDCPDASSSPPDTGRRATMDVT